MILFAIEMVELKLKSSSLKIFYHLITLCLIWSSKLQRMTMTKVSGLKIYRRVEL